MKERERQAKHVLRTNKSPVTCNKIIYGHILLTWCGGGKRRIKFRGSIGVFAF